MNKIGNYIKQERKKAGLTQEEFAMRSGLGLRFVRKCLYCGKDIREIASKEEKEAAWHKRCMKVFFGTKTMPIIDITDAQLEALANDTVNKGLTVPGVQKKLSLHLSQETDTRLTIVNYPTGYILKPQTEQYDSLPEFEDLAMRMAELTGIKVVSHALV